MAYSCNAGQLVMPIFFWRSCRKVLKHDSHTEVCLGLQDLARSCQSTKLSPRSLGGSELIQALVEESLGTSELPSCCLQYYLDMMS